MILSLIKDRYSGIQDLFRNIDTDGCLFLCLCTIIEEVTGKPADIVAMIQISRKNKWITPDFHINDSLQILNYFTGLTFKRREVGNLPSVIHENEFSIEKWYNPRTKKEHFKRRFVDTLLGSITVQEGKVAGYYIYYY